MSSRDLSLRWIGWEFNTRLSSALNLVEQSSSTAKKGHRVLNRSWEVNSVLAKFIMSIGDEAFKLLSSEADNRDVTVQQLLRAVVVPEWIRENLTQPSLQSSGTIRPSIYGTVNRQNDNMLLSPVNRLRH
jgi:hypothetical protein